MGQVTSGVRSVLSHPSVYNVVQSAFGARASRREVIAKYVRPAPGCRLLDIGCGTGEILELLPEDVEYWGFDLSPEYISSARARYGFRGRFECADVAQYLSTNDLPAADIVIAIGVLHHLDPGPAEDLIEIAWLALREGGRLVTVDPTFAQGQSRSSTWLVGRDRGQGVLRPEGFAALAATRFNDPTVTVRHDLLRIPYSHCIVECIK